MDSIHRFTWKGKFPIALPYHVRNTLYVLSTMLERLANNGEVICTGLAFHACKRYDYHELYLDVRTNSAAWHDTNALVANAI